MQAAPPTFACGDDPPPDFQPSQAARALKVLLVIDGLKEITHELKGVGRNLNRLVIQAN